MLRRTESSPAAAAPTALDAASSFVEAEASSPAAQSDADRGASTGTSAPALGLNAAVPRHVPTPAQSGGRVPPPVTPRAFSCRCGRPVFFRNSECLACHTPLGYDPERRELMPLEQVPANTAKGSAQDASNGTGADSAAPGAPGGDGSTTAAPAPAPALWRHAEAGDEATRYQRCANLDTAAACNWLVVEGDPLAPLCRCCRLTRTLPDLTQDRSALFWNRIEMAKRRLVSSLIALNLPVRSKVSEDPEHGMVFDLLRAAPGQPPVITGHDDGVITLDVEEADDAWREQRRTELAEPYRTLLGHLRHECGHYYWQRLVEHSRWLAPYRKAFGDERLDYAEALKKHYADGPPSNWELRFVSAYASSHPWEDWAETWAHYLHLVDTLDTARSFGLDGERVELSYERFDISVISDGGADAPEAQEFLQLINGWMELTGVLNELSRSMGVQDFYPFVLSLPAVRKLYFVHRVVAAAGRDGVASIGDQKKTPELASAAA